MSNSELAFCVCACAEWKCIFNGSLYECFSVNATLLTQAVLHKINVNLHKDWNYIAIHIPSVFNMVLFI